MPKQQYPTKIFLDSRYALPDGSLEIPGGGLECDPSDRLWVTEFSTVSSWWTIDYTNDILYIIEEITVGVRNKRQVILTHGPHDIDSLATQIASALNGPGKHPSMGTYTCTRVTGAEGGGAGGKLTNPYTSPAPILISDCQTPTP